MPSISNKAKELPASAIRKLTPYADAAEEAGIKVYHLNIGAPDIKSPETAFEAIRNFNADHLPYSNSCGLIELREALVEKYYKKIGINISVTDILVDMACTEALSQAMQVACNPGEEIILIEPYYTNYYSLLYQSDIKATVIHTDIRDGFKAPSMEDFENAWNPNVKAVLLCNPVNPTGTLYSKEQMIEIGEFCRRHDIFLISDEAYREFCYTDEPLFSAMCIPGCEKNVILVDSVSKRYNLCGVRIGCLVSRNKEVIETALKYSQARLCAPVLGQIATLGALDAPKSYYDSTRDEYIARRDYTVDALNRIPGVFSPKPDGAFYTIAELPVDSGEKFAKWLLTDFRLDGETLMITPAEDFYSNKEYGRRHVRIAYVLGIPDLQKSMRILEEALKAYPGRI